jgi:hypothetical protein
MTGVIVVIAPDRGNDVTIKTICERFHGTPSLEATGRGERLAVRTKEGQVEKKRLGNLHLFKRPSGQRSPPLPLQSVSRLPASARYRGSPGEPGFGVPRDLRAWRR